MGTKKLSLKQIEKMQERKDKKPKGSKQERIERSETLMKYGIFLPNLKSKKTLNELKKIKALTPYTVASQFNLRLSVAKQFLKELEKYGQIEHVSSGRNIKIYKVIEQ